MRRLVWLAVGAGGGCALCAYILRSTWLLPGAGVLLVLALVLRLAAGNKTLLRRLCLIFLGCGLGIPWFGIYYLLHLEPAVRLDGQTRSITLTILEESWQTDYGSGMEGTARIDGRTYRICAYVDDTEPISPGDQLQGQFRLRTTLPNGQEPATYHRGNGIFLLAYSQDQVQITRGTGMSWRTFPGELRNRFLDVLEKYFPEDCLAFAKALLLGDTQDLDYATDTALKISGIRHVAAVSGLHISILVGFLTTVTFRKRYLTALLGIPVLVIFAAAAGFTPSVTRASLMSGLLLLSQIVNREYDSPSALGFAVLVMLGINPLVVTSVGFQLSVGSVAGIYLFSNPIRDWLMARLWREGKLRKRIAGWFAGSASVSLGATVMTAPLCAGYFGMVSLIGVLTNLLTLWLITLLFYGIGVVCLLGMVWQTPAGVLAGILSPGIRLVLWTARTLSGFPLAAVYTRSPYIVIWLCFVYVLLGIFLLSKVRSPEALTGLAALGLCFALLASWAESVLPGTRLTVLDVGQGQCLLLQAEGKTYMVDCGGESDDTTADIAASALLSQGISRLDGLILTHFDRDHAGAVENLLSRVSTEVLILPAQSNSLSLPENTRVIYADRDLRLSFAGVELTVYPPDFPGDSNESSLCVLFDTKKCDILITGDRDGFGERSLLRNADIPQVDVLIAGHHGSKNSVCEELLQAVEPEIVCISVGADNPYGHPAPELLERLDTWGCRVFRTDLQGDIVIRR